MGFKEMVSKTTIANLVAGACVIGALGYFIAIRHTDGVVFLAGSGIGYLFKILKEKVE